MSINHQVEIDETLNNGKFTIDDNDDDTTEYFTSKGGFHSRWSYALKRNPIANFLSRHKFSFLIAIANILLLIILISIGFIIYGFTTRNGYFCYYGNGKNDTNTSIPLPLNSFKDYIAKERLYKHLKALSDVASLFPRNSRAPRYGYNASIDYVINTLKAEAPQLSLMRQHFPVKIFESITPSNMTMNSPANYTYLLKRDFLDMGGFVGKSIISAKNVSVIKNLGCSDSDFIGFPKGNIALIKRGDCAFIDKAKKAITSFGASAVLIYNDGASSDRLYPFNGHFGEEVPAPVFSLSYNVGIFLLESKETVTLTLSVNAVIHIVITSNLCADTPRVVGGNEQVILFGSHLDSVEAGPGINDNGSGTAANLELAIQYFKYFKGTTANNNFRFCWWGAEEMGLLGSTFYVSQLTPRDKRRIAANINLDMIGSPNKFYGIYNGTMADEPIRKRSEYIASLFIEYMNLDTNKRGSGPSKPIPYDLIPFDGRSDYGPFIANGTYIPAGGLFTGAEVLKSEEERKRYGGLTNAAFDPCYHQACDTLENVDMDALLLMSKASAYVTEKLYKWNGQ